MESLSKSNLSYPNLLTNSPIFFAYRSRDYNAHFTATFRTVSVYRVLHRCEAYGYADVLPVLQVPGNKADAVPYYNRSQGAAYARRTVFSQVGLRPFFYHFQVAEIDIGLRSLAVEE